MEFKVQPIGTNNFYRISKEFRSEMIQAYNLMLEDTLKIVQESSDEDTPDEIIAKIKELF